MNKLLLTYLRYFPISHGKHFISRWVDLTHITDPVIYKNQLDIFFELNVHEYQMRQIYLYDLYEKNTLKNLLHLCNPAMTAIDVGANIGSYTLALAKHLTHGKVFAFEPSSVSFNLLKKNILLNNLTNIRMFQQGLADKKKTGYLNHNIKNLGAASLFEKNSETSEIVQLGTLDDFCEENKLGKIDIIKVDIEGGELNFLIGAKKTLTQNKKIILVMEVVEEHCHRAGYSANELFKYVLDFGFTAYAPKSWPYRLKKISHIPDNYFDNVIFIKN